jgi:hypothetical protein
MVVVWGSYTWMRCLACFTFTYGPAGSLVLVRQGYVPIFCALGFRDDAVQIVEE